MGCGYEDCLADDLKKFPFDHFSSVTRESRDHRHCVARCIRHRPGKIRDHARDVRTIGKTLGRDGAINNLMIGEGQPGHSRRARPWNVRFKDNGSRPILTNSGDKTWRWDGDVTG